MRKSKTLSGLVMRTALITLAVITVLSLAAGFIFVAAAPGKAADTFYGLGMEKQAFRLYEKDYERNSGDINKLAALCDLSVELMPKDNSYAKSAYTYILRLRNDTQFAAYADARNRFDTDSVPLADKPHMANYENFISTSLTKAYLLSGKRTEAAATVESDFTRAFAAGVIASEDYGAAVSALPNRSFSVFVEDAFLREGSERFGFLFSVTESGVSATGLYDAICGTATKIPDILDANLSSENKDVIFNSALYALWQLYTSSDMRLIFKALTAYAEGQGYSELKAYGEAEETCWKELYDGAAVFYNSLMDKYAAFMQ